MFASLMKRLDGHKTKLGNSLLLLATQMPPSKEQMVVFTIGSLLTGVGIADVFRKILIGK